MSFKDFINESKNESDMHFKNAFNEFTKAALNLERIWEKLGADSSFHNNKKLNDLIQKTFKHDFSDTAFAIQEMNHIVKG